MAWPRRSQLLWNSMAPSYSALHLSCEPENGELFDTAQPYPSLHLPQRLSDNVFPYCVLLNVWVQYVFYGKDSGAQIFLIFLLYYYFRDVIGAFDPAAELFTAHVVKESATADSFILLTWKFVITNLIQWIKITNFLLFYKHFLRFVIDDPLDISVLFDVANHSKVTSKLFSHCHVLLLSPWI